MSLNDAAACWLTLRWCEHLVLSSMLRGIEEIVDPLPEPPQPEMLRKELLSS